MRREHDPKRQPRLETPETASSFRNKTNPPVKEEMSKENMVNEEKDLSREKSHEKRNMQIAMNIGEFSIVNFLADSKNYRIKNPFQSVSK